MQVGGNTPHVVVNRWQNWNRLLAHIHTCKDASRLGNARQALLNRLTTIDPDMARQVITMRTLSRMETYFLQIAFWVTLVLGALALALTLSGLFSVLSYLVEQRTKEIGVRMALGASARQVTRFILSQASRPPACASRIAPASGWCGLPRLPRRRSPFS